MKNHNELGKKVKSVDLDVALPENHIGNQLHIKITDELRDEINNSRNKFCEYNQINVSINQFVIKLISDGLERNLK